MKRFYFNLEGNANLTDPGGLVFYNEIEAFFVAQKLARELADSRPDLRGNTAVVVTDGEISQRYSIGISNVAQPKSDTALRRASGSCPGRIKSANGGFEPTPPQNIRSEAVVAARGASARSLMAQMAHSRQE